MCAVPQTSNTQPTRAEHVRYTRTALSTNMARVLVVDDIPANLLSLQAALGHLPAELVTAGSGEEALKAAAHGDFAVALLDVMMPVMDGLATARALKALQPRLPIMFLTAQDEHGSFRNEAYALGGVDYLIKPFDLNVIRQKVAAFLG